MPRNQFSIEIYLIRYAETVMNTNPHLVGGCSNKTPFTPNGVEQAKRLGKVMLKKQILPVKAFAALRTLDTARYSLAEMGPDIKPDIQDAIQELGHRHHLSVQIVMHNFNNYLSYTHKTLP